MNWEVLIAIGIGLAVYAVLAYFRGWFPFPRPKAATRTTAPGIVLPEEFAFQYNRPDGGYIFSVYEIPAAVLATVIQTVERGLGESILAMKQANPTWNVMATTGEHWIACIEPMATNQDGSPALIVGGHQSAGTVINVGSDFGVPPIIVLPAQRNWNYLDYLYNSVYNEVEHAFEWKNDVSVFWQFVGAGDIHPHWPRVEPGLRGLFGNKRIHANCSGVHRPASKVPNVLTPKDSAE